MSSQESGKGEIRLLFSMLIPCEHTVRLKEIPLR